MKYLIEKERLEDLLKKELLAEALEKGGVDNWEWYSQSISSYEESEGTDISKIILDEYNFEEYNLSDSPYIKGIYNKGQEIYYINTPCYFEGYVNTDTCIVSIKLEIDQDDVHDEFIGKCMNCMVGGGNNAPAMSCDCDDTLNRLEVLSDFINETEHKRYIICKETQLNNISLIQRNHTKEIERNRELVYKEKREFRDLQIKQIEIKKNISLLEIELKAKQNIIDLD